MSFRGIRQTLASGGTPAPDPHVTRAARLFYTSRVHTLYEMSRFVGETATAVDLDVGGDDVTLVQIFSIASGHLKLLFC